MKKIYCLFMVAFVLLAFQTQVGAQAYHFQHNFDTDASDTFEGWETNKDVDGGTGVASTTSSSFCVTGKGLKFRAATASINTSDSYANAGVLEFYLLGGNDFSTDPDPVLSVLVSADKTTWESVYTITHSALETSMASSGLLYEKISINLDRTDAIYIKFESVSADDGNYPFGIDDVSLTNTVTISDDNTELQSVSTDSKTVSYENIVLTDNGAGLFLANDSIGLDEDITLAATPLDERATVVFSKQANPEAGLSDKAVFTVNAFDGSTTKDYEVVIARSVYQCKQGFMGKGDASSVAGGGWVSTGGFYATDSKGNGGMFPGNNAMRIYLSSSKGEGALTSPEYTKVGSLSFSAKFSKADDESLTVQKSLDQGTTWIDVITYTPAGGEFPSYTTEDAADVLARQTVSIEELNVMIRFQFNGASTTPRTMIDDILIDANVAADETAPVLSNVTAGPVLVGADISATSNEDGVIYLVPEGTANTVEAITGAKVAEAAATAEVALTLGTSGVAAGNYVVYAMDAVQNISDASAVITVNPLDETAPVLSNVTVGSILVGTDISATSNEDGVIYLVPEGTAKTVEAITGAKVAEATATEDVATTLSTTDLTSGNFMVYAMDAVQNISDASALINVRGVSVNDKLTQSVSIYPNPASDYINISGNPSEVQIYNVVGKLVISVSNSDHIDIQFLSKGIYFVKVNKQVQKIMVN